MKFARLLNPSIRNLHEFTDMSRLLLNISLIEPGEGGHQKKRTPLIFICQTQAAGRGPCPSLYGLHGTQGKLRREVLWGRSVGFALNSAGPHLCPRLPMAVSRKPQHQNETTPRRILN